MNLNEFYEAATVQADQFKRAHRAAQQIDGTSLYSEEMTEKEWWEAMEKWRSHQE